MKFSLKMLMGRDRRKLEVPVTALLPLLGIVPMDRGALLEVPKVEVPTCSSIYSTNIY